MLEALEPSMVEAVPELAGRLLELIDMPETVFDIIGPCDSVGAVKELPDITDAVLDTADMTGEVFEPDDMVAAPLEPAGIEVVTLEPADIEAVPAPLPETTLEAPVPVVAVIDPLPTTPVGDGMPEAKPVATTEEVLAQIMHET